MAHHPLKLLALTLVPGLGDWNIKQLISYCGSADEVFKVPKRKLESIPGIGPKTVNAILQHQTFDEAEAILTEADKKGMNVLSYLDADYPQRMKSQMDAPAILFTKGNGDLNPSRTLAIVGTRKATSYGKHVTQKIVEDLSAMNVQIISGLAYGIDIEAHKAALKHRTSTVAVLAGGLDWIYPSTHKKYAEDMQAEGAILSESIPGTKPDPHLFPARNRIIAGMADAVIVVEAAEKGGALITAKIADSYNRALFAVPGNLDHAYSAGTNKLIASQLALIYTGVEDLAVQLSWDAESAKKEKAPLPELTDDEEKIYQLLLQKGQPVEIDLLAIQAQFPINKVASVLLGLEFKNLVKSIPGKKYGVM
jgi:DNA processing protein